MVESGGLKIEYPGGAHCFPNGRASGRIFPAHPDYFIGLCRYKADLLIQNLRRMQNRYWEKAARANRRKAVVLTVLFHLALLGGLALGTHAKLTEFIPDFIIKQLPADWQPGPGDQAPADQASL